LPRTSFNPHPSRRTGATRLRSKPGACHHPFQSSPVPKDGCNASLWTSPGGRSRFQSSPVPKDGCNPSDLTLELLRERFRFNPHPSRRTGATCCRRLVYNGDAGFQSSPVPKDGCNKWYLLLEQWDHEVSILTRPEGRVQPNTKEIYGVAGDVSILTRPEGRVQLCCSLPNRSEVKLFQSSPVPKDGCNLTRSRPLLMPSSFQSSPVPKDGCNDLPVCEGALVDGFNPHPSRRTGATNTLGGDFNARSSFNPHPSRRTGATPSVVVFLAPRTVSILTRPEGRVQLLLVVSKSTADAFQSSPVPKDGCNPMTKCVQTGAELFQSSPVPKDGCNPMSNSELDIALRVSILTRPEGRVQQWAVSLGDVGNAGFNPHPSRRTGATPSSLFHSGHLTRVSILTRPEGRVQRSRCAAP